MQHNSSGAESSPATEHTAASAEITMDMQAVVTELSQLSTDAAREIVHAAQILSTGNQKAVRDLCTPWGVQRYEQKRNRPLDIIKDELRMAVTKRAKKLKMENEACHRDQHPATEHTTAAVCIETKQGLP